MARCALASLVEAIIFIDLVIFSMFLTDLTRCSISRSVASCRPELWKLATATAAGAAAADLVEAREAAARTGRAVRESILRGSWDVGVCLFLSQEAGWSTRAASYSLCLCSEDARAAASSSSSASAGSLSLCWLGRARGGGCGGRQNCKPTPLHELSLIYKLNCPLTNLAKK